MQDEVVYIWSIPHTLSHDHVDDKITSNRSWQGRPFIQLGAADTEQKPASGKNSPTQKGLWLFHPYQWSIINIEYIQIKLHCIL